MNNLKTWIFALMTLILSPLVQGQVNSPVRFNGHEMGGHNNDHGHMVERETPSWQLQDAKGETYSSETLVGKPHVLIFHLGKGCLECSQQLKTFSENAPSFRQAGVSVVAISSDTQAELNQAMSDLEKPLEIQMLSDASFGTFKSFRAFDSFNDQALHATILVDAKGQIRWQDIGEHPFTDTEQLLQTITTVATQVAQQDQESDLQRPTIFFNRSPRIMKYQLERLSSERLLLVERSVNDKKYVPVYREILGREGISPRVRDEAITALVKLNNSNPAEELLAAIDRLRQGAQKEKKENRESTSQGLEQLVKMLWRQSPEDLAKQSETFLSAIQSENKFHQSVGYAGLIASGKSNLAWKTTLAEKGQKQWMAAVSLVPVPLRSAERSRVVGMIGKGPTTTQAALATLSDIPEQQGNTFQLAAEAVRDSRYSAAALNTLLRVPSEDRDPTISAGLVEYLVDFAEASRPKDRTSDDFLTAMRLVDQLMVSVPDAKAKKYRKRLGAVTVRVVQLNTVEDEMRYDVPYFAVEAGSSVQIILNNEDFMAHNLVITRAGKLKEVAEQGGAAGPTKSYLPADRGNILFSTKMIDANQKARLRFKAPKEIGEYPYVCTFPQHWSRMYGVMVVVEDLDAWLKNPVKPVDPIGNTRSLVADWTVDELKGELAEGIRNRNDEVGAKIYAEATCLQCHQLRGNGGNVGPALDAVYSRHKNDRSAILREIIEPSHFIAKEYRMHKILTVDNLTIVGIIKSKTDEEIKLLVNPEATELTTVLVDDIEQMAEVSQSIMPKALMNNFTKEEIFELMSYLEKSQVEADK